MEEKKGKQTSIIFKKAKFVLLASFYYFFALYLQGSEFFTNHFYPGTEINSISVGCKSPSAAKEKIDSALTDYTITFNGRNDESQSIKGSDINLKLQDEKEFTKLKDRQNMSSWVCGLFNMELIKDDTKTVFDEKKLKEKIDNLTFFKNTIEPKNPEFKYTDTGYVILNEIQGTKIDKNSLYLKTVDSILKGEAEINIEAAGCYIKPQYTAESKKVTDTRDTLNKYVSSKINYTFGNSSEALDGNIINKWLSVNDNLEIVVDRNKVNSFLDMLSTKYNTAGKTRHFKTSSGSYLDIGGGDYGFVINKDKESENIITAVKDGKTLIKEPEYSNTGLFRGENDIGSTYVEIDLNRQHMWFYKNGSLLVQGGVVTGNISNHTGTPRGIYSLKYKMRNAVLKGPGYEAPVNYWMPFNGGIGIHDASWRGEFGGNIYIYNGSHGCVNTSYSVAQAIFNNIDANTPVVCY
ncbi:MAG: L,D-transpeptidase family protein [Solirubrobacterales bacterium]